MALVDSRYSVVCSHGFVLRALVLLCSCTLYFLVYVVVLYRLYSVLLVYDVVLYRLYSAACTLAVEHHVGPCMLHVNIEIVLSGRRNRESRRNKEA